MIRTLVVVIIWIVFGLGFADFDIRFKDGYKIKLRGWGMRIKKSKKSKRKAQP